jgi:hypothetical protein
MQGVRRHVNAVVKFNGVKSVAAKKASDEKETSPDSLLGGVGSMPILAIGCCYQS